MNPGTSIRTISPLDPDVQQLIGQLDAANRQLYPEGPNYLTSAQTLAADGVMVGLAQDDRLVAMGV